MFQLVEMSDAQAVARKVADEVCSCVSGAARSVLLPAGSTPRPLYAELVARARAGVDLSRLHGFQLDEVVGLEASDAESFQAFLQRELVRPLATSGSPACSFHLLDGGASDPAAEIARHAAALDAAPPLELAILGLGLNGHVAFNEPPCAEDAPARVVELAPATVGVLGDAAERGMTLGLREILSARRILVLVTGAKKARILSRLLASEPDPALPASLLRLHARCELLADAAALGQGVGPNGAPQSVEA